MPTCTDPQTGDLNSPRTEGRVPATDYMATPIENTLSFHRSDGHKVGYALQHFDDVRQLHLVVLDPDPDLCEIKQEIELSYAEARMLKSFLCRPDISEILSQE